MELARKFNIPAPLGPVTPRRSDYYPQLASAIDQPIVTELPYRELVGALIFVMVGTRPDIAFAVSSSLTIFQRLVHYTGNKHFDALVIWWELLSLLSSWVLVAQRNWWPTQMVIGLVTQSPDVQWGILDFLWEFSSLLGTKPQQGIIALSSTKAKFIQQALSVRQVLFVQPIFVQRKTFVQTFTVLYGDNLPAIQAIGNNSAHF